MLHSNTREGHFDLRAWLDALVMDGGARRFYTGVGARETPEWALELLTSLARLLYVHGYWVRSGAARGADSAVEAGAGDRKEIYLPYRRFRGHGSPLYVASDEAVALAASIHPAWHNCNDFARQAHSRNMHQVLGRDLRHPSDFLVCYTKDGALTEDQTSDRTGGTRSAICLASRHGIPVLNLGYGPHAEMIAALVKEVV